jgi:hypothetical protein
MSVPTPPELIEAWSARIAYRIGQLESSGVRFHDLPAEYADAVAASPEFVALARALGREALWSDSDGDGPVRALIDAHGLPEWLAEWCVALAQEAQG